MKTVQIFLKEAVEADPGIDLAIGNNRKKDIAAILEEYLERRREGGPERDKTLEGATVLDIAAWHGAASVCSSCPRCW